MTCPRSGVAMSSSEHDTVAPESRNREEEEERVTDDAVPRSMPADNVLMFTIQNEIT